jgi:phosphatidylglycerophosphate synthase
MIAGLVGGGLLAATRLDREHAVLLYLAAVACVQLRLLANLLDGMVAIQSGKASRVGELYNEVPDRVSDTAFFVGAGYAVGSEPLLGLWAALAAMATAYVRTTGKTAGAPMGFCGPMAKQHRMAVLTIAAITCAVTSLFESTAGWPIMKATLWLILVGSVITCIRRLLRIARFLKNPPLRDVI